MQTSIHPKRRLSPKQCVCLGTAFLLGLSGCGQVAPSKTATGAGTGAAIGALGGAAVGANSSMGTGVGALGGAAAGAIVGGVIGAISDAKEKREQYNLAQERAYQQEQAKKKAEDARIKADMEEQLALQKGFRITDLEMAEAKRLADESEARLKRAEEERAGAIAKTKELNDYHEKQLAATAKAAAIEEEIARMKADTPLTAPTTADATPAIVNPPLTP